MSEQEEQTSRATISSKRKNGWLVWSVVALLMIGGLWLISLGGSGEAPADADQNERDGTHREEYAGDFLIQPATLERLQVAVSDDNPPRVVATVRGVLEDGCTEVHEHSVSFSGSVFDIVIETRRPKEGVCTQIFGFFEEEFVLPVSGLSGGVYTVVANDELIETFELPEPETPESGPDGNVEELLQVS